MTGQVDSINSPAVEWKLFSRFDFSSFEVPLNGILLCKLPNSGTVTDYAYHSWSYHVGYGKQFVKFVFAKQSSKELLYKLPA